MKAVGAPLILPRLISLALHEIQALGADTALAWCLRWSPNSNAHRKAGFYPLTERLRPIRVNFGARNLRADTNLAGNSRRWYISYMDSDTA